MRALVLVMMLEALAVASVRGTVADDTGKPIANASVTGCPNSSPELLGSLYIVQHAAGLKAAVADSKRMGYGECKQTTTDAAGAWTLELGPGQNPGVLIVAPGRALVVEPLEAKHFKGASLSTTMDPDSPVTLDMTCDRCGQITLHFYYRPHPQRFAKTTLWTQLDKPDKIELVGLHRGELELYAYSALRYGNERIGRTAKLILGGSPMTAKLPLVKTGTGKSITGHMTFTGGGGPEGFWLRCKSDPKEDLIREFKPTSSGDFVIDDVPPGPCKLEIHVRGGTDCTGPLPVLRPGANVELRICVKLDVRRP